MPAMTPLKTTRICLCESAPPVSASPDAATSARATATSSRPSSSRRPGRAQRGVHELLDEAAAFHLEAVLPDGLRHERVVERAAEQQTREDARRRCHVRSGRRPARADVVGDGVEGSPGLEVETRSRSRNCAARAGSPTTALISGIVSAVTRSRSSTTSIRTLRTDALAGLRPAGGGTSRPPSRGRRPGRDRSCPRSGCRSCPRHAGLGGDLLRRRAGHAAPGHHALGGLDEPRALVRNRWGEGQLAVSV